MNITCRYRIYPWWRGFGRDPAGAPMRELSNNAAKAMGRTVLDIQIESVVVDYGVDYHIDFSVTYSSTNVLEMTR